MPEYDAERLDELGAPMDRPVETLDARELPPPEPLQRSLETLADLDDETVFVQLNDRVPSHLFPQLDDRGFAHVTDDGDVAVTAIWREEG